MAGLRMLGHCHHPVEEEEGEGPQPEEEEEVEVQPDPRIPEGGVTLAVWSLRLMGDGQF